MSFPGQATVGAGQGTSCAIGTGTDVGIWCWGSIQTPETEDSIAESPTLLSSDEPLLELSVGQASACAITQQSGKLNCWGDLATPLGIDAQERWVGVSLGNKYGCGVLFTGRAVCWGDCTGDECGPGPPIELPGGGQLYYVSNSRPNFGWLLISASISDIDNNVSPHTCAIEEFRAWCWGDNTFGQLGDGTQTSSAVPREVAGGRTWQQVCAGSGYSCGISTDSELYCWGIQIPVANNLYGTRPVQMEILVGSDRLWSSVSCGMYHACAIEESSRQIYCWGDNSYGQLGDGTNESSQSAVLVIPEGNIGWAEVSAGGTQTCGRDGVTREIYCWGFAEGGQLGIGTIDQDYYDTPQRVSLGFIGLPPPVPVLPPPIVIPPVPPSPDQSPDPILSSPPSPINATPPTAAASPPPIAPSPGPAVETSSSTNIGAIAGGVVGGLLILGLLIFALVYFIRRRRRNKEGEEASPKDVASASSIDESPRSQGTGSPDEMDVEHLGAKNAIDAKDSSDLAECVVVPENIIEPHSISRDEEAKSHPVMQTSVDIPMSKEPESEAHNNDRVPQHAVESVGAFASQMENIADKESSADQTFSNKDILEDPSQSAASNSQYSDVGTTEEETNISASMDDDDGTPVSPVLSYEKKFQFNTEILEEKLSIYRDADFVLLYQLSQHFEHVREYRSKQDRYTKWYKPSKAVPDDILETAGVSSLKYVSKDKQRFLQEYAGRLEGLKRTYEALEHWPVETTNNLGDSCRSLYSLITDITAPVWDLGITKSLFHANRQRYKLPWDESLYFDVYNTAQDVARSAMKRAVEIVSQDKGYEPGFFSTIKKHIFTETIHAFADIADHFPTGHSI